MQFANPAFLFALSALAVPVIIHLFNLRRYRKVWFTNVSRLELVREETHRYSRLKDYLILVSRMLAILFLVLAFSRPYIPATPENKPGQGEHAVSIFLDNSFSMEAGTTNRQLFILAKSKIRDILNAYRESDHFQLLTPDFKGEELRFGTRDELLQRLDAVDIGSSPAIISQAVKFQTAQLNASSCLMRHGYIVSDFQKAFTDFSTLRADSAVNIFLVPVSTLKPSNLCIDSIYFDSPVHLPGTVSRLHVNIRNTGPEPIEKIPVKLFINALQKNVGSIDVQAESENELIIPYTENPGGIQFGKISIADYPVTFDDDFFFAYSIQQQIPILALFENNPDPYLQALFSNDSNTSFTSLHTRQLDYNSMLRYPCIILNSVREIPSGLSQSLINFLHQGGSLVIFPPPNTAGNDLQRFLQMTGSPTLGAFDTTTQYITEVNFSHPLYRDVFLKPDNSNRYDLPLVYRHFVQQPVRNNPAEHLLTLANGDPFLTVSHALRGKVYLFSAPTDTRSSLFPVHAIFVPTLMQIAIHSIHQPPYYYTAGTNEPVSVSGLNIPRDPVFAFKEAGGGSVVIPESRISGGTVKLFSHKQITRAGHYFVTSHTDTLTGIAFNFDAKESSPECYDKTALEDMVRRYDLSHFRVLDQSEKQLTRSIQEARQGTSLWKLSLLIALFFLLTEILLIRLLRN